MNPLLCLLSHRGQSDRGTDFLAPVDPTPFRICPEMMTSAPTASHAFHSPLPPQFSRVKMAPSDVEPFPPLNDKFAKKEGHKGGKTVRRRKSSGLGAELFGDNDVAAFATLGSGVLPATPTEPVRSQLSLYRGRRRLARKVYADTVHSEKSPPVVPSAAP